MSWTDIFLEHCPDERALQKALARVFAVKPAEVEVVRSYTDGAGSTPVRAVMTTVRGDFGCMLTISTDRDLEDVDQMAGVRQLCVALATCAFTPGESIDPYAGFFVDDKGRDRKARLDADAEGAGEYRLRRAAP